MTVYKGYQIRKSGKFFKIIKNGEWVFFHRFISIAAAQVAIDAQGRVMTPAEHAIMHPDYTAWRAGK